MNPLALVPLPYRLAALALLAVALLAFGYLKGAESVQREWDAERARQAVETVRIIVKQGEVTDRIVTEYVDRVKVIRETGQTIIKEVPIYVPADSPDLPGGFRLLHDAAAAGAIPDPAGQPDAAAVPAQTAAGTVVDNYTTCLETGERLTKLQQWVQEQRALSP